MKINLYIFMIASILVQSCTQKSTEEKKTEKADTIVNKLKMESQKVNAMSCKLTDPELQLRKATTIKQLKDSLKKRIELENGYSYFFDDSDQVLDMLNDFIKTERQCCDFFNFNIAVNNMGSITLSITGNKGAKDFINSELEM